MEVVPDYPVLICLALEANLQVTSLSNQGLHLIGVERLSSSRIRLLEPVVSAGHSIGAIITCCLIIRVSIVVTQSRGIVIVERCGAVFCLNVLYFLVNNTAIEVGLSRDVCVVMTGEALKRHFICTLGQICNGLAQVELGVPCLEVVGCKAMLRNSTAFKRPTSCNLSPTTYTIGEVRINNQECEVEALFIGRLSSLDVCGHGSLQCCCGVWYGLTNESKGFCLCSQNTSWSGDIGIVDFLSQCADSVELCVDGLLQRCISLGVIVAHGNQCVSTLLQLIPC